MSADPLHATRPALACFELVSVSRGIVVLDQMAKRAETTIVAARTFSPGRYLILICGELAEVEEAAASAVACADDLLHDHTLLQDPHPRLRSALASALSSELAESLLLVETRTVSSALFVLDRALKEAEVDVIELRLGAGLDGRGLFSLTGPLPMVEAARDLCQELLTEERLFRVDLIAQPHPDLPRHLLGAEPAAPRR